MKKTAFFGICLLGFLAILTAAPNYAEKAEPDSPALSCELRDNDGHHNSIIDYPPTVGCSGNMHFILYAKRDGIKIFEGWNSWGYGMRFFTASSDNDSKIYTIKRCGGRWTMNYPSTLTLNQGQFLITDIGLCDGTWCITPNLPYQSDTHLLITPHFQIKAGSVSKKYAVWTGHIEGAPTSIWIMKGGIARLNKNLK